MVYHETGNGANEKESENHDINESKSRVEFLSGYPDVQKANQNKISQLLLVNDGTGKSSTINSAKSANNKIIDISNVNENDDETKDEMCETTKPPQSPSSTPSLMELMMEEATKAKSKQIQKKIEEERKSSKSSMKMKEGSSLFKKGFLTNNTKPSKKNKNGTNTNKFDDKQNQTSSQRIGNQKNKNDSKIPTITPYKTNKNQILNDIQKQKSEIMNNHPLLKSKDKWLTPDIQKQVENNKILSEGMTNPKFMQALQLLQDDPKKAMKELRDGGHNDVIEYINEFSRVMGDHFNTLGGGAGASSEKEEKLIEEIIDKDIKDQNDRNKSHVMDSKAIGPLAMDAWKKNNNSSPPPVSKEDQKKIDTIISNKELTDLLMDVDLQTQIQQCGEYPGKLQDLMRHPNYGPKIRKLIDAGLLKVVR